MENKHKTINKLYKFIPDSKFFQNVLILVGGTASAQGIVILVSPILTRLYNPEDFGLLAAYISILSILSVVASLRYNIAIPLPEDDETAVNLVYLSMFIVAVLCLFLLITVLFFEELILNFLKIPDMGNYLWILPISFLGVGLYQLLNYWAIRQKLFKEIAKTKLMQSLSQVGIQLTAGAISLGPLGLLIGDSAGRISGSGRLLSLFLKHNKKFFSNISISSMSNAAYRYRKFPLLSSGSAFLNSAGLQLAPLLLVAMYNPQVAGWFALGQRVVGAPMSLIGTSVAQVYFGEASRLASVDQEKLRQLFYRTAKRLFLIGVIPIVTVSVGGPWIFGLVFGQDWLEAGKYIQVLGIMFLVQFIVVPLSQTLNILERQDWQLAWDLGRFLLVICAFMIANMLKLSGLQAIILYGFVITIAYVGLFALSSIAVKTNKEVNIDKVN